VRAVLLAMLAVLAASPSAYGQPLRLRDAGAVGPVARGDGERYIASSASEGMVTLLDLRSHERRTIPTPAGCGLKDMHRGTLLWACSVSSPSLFSPGLTYDTASGRAGALPPPRPMPSSDASQGLYEAIGERWAQARISGYHYAYRVYVERASGRQRSVKDRRDRVVDLDAPSLTRKLCSGQRRPYVSDESGLSTELGDLATAGRWAAATTYPFSGSPGRVELQRCGARPRTLAVCREVVCTQPVIDARVVAWAETRYVTRYHEPPSGRLVVRSLRTGRTRRTRIVRASLTPLLIAGRLFVATPNRLLGAAP
jgi:hypothetical protein